MIYVCAKTPLELGASRPWQPRDACKMISIHVQKIVVGVKATQKSLMSKFDTKSFFVRDLDREI